MSDKGLFLPANVVASSRATFSCRAARKSAACALA
jgi:hypothetical protein